MRQRNIYEKKKLNKSDTDDRAKKCNENGTIRTGTGVPGKRNVSFVNYILIRSSKRNKNNFGKSQMGPHYLRITLTENLKVWQKKNRGV